MNMVEIRSDDQAPKRGENVSVVRYGVSGSATTQK
jgi:pilus assembly protein CpaB